MASTSQLSISTADRIDVVRHCSFPYSEKVREQILAVSNAVAHVAAVSRVNFMLPELYAKALKRCGVPLGTIQLIGCHGQTIFHERGNTLQIGDGSVLAERTGIPVVSDFRPRDIAAGGHGAPLVPFVDYRLFRDAKLGRVVLNIGGIANLTAIPAGGTPDAVVAFDTGPGNMVVDQLVSIYTRGKHSYDRNGAIAAQGRLDRVLLSSLLRRKFYRQRPPKTAGREQYGREFIAELRGMKSSMLDLITTATVLTPASVAVAIERFITHPVHEVIVAGGGVHNQTMIAYLQAFLPNMRVRTSSEFGIDSDAKEAIAFAILAHETWHRRPSNLPSATGASRAVVLGKVSF